MPEPMTVDEINRRFTREVSAAKLHTPPGHRHRAILVLNARDRRRKRLAKLGIRAWR